MKFGILLLSDGLHLAASAAAFFYVRLVKRVGYKPDGRESDLGLRASVEK